MIITWGVFNLNFELILREKYLENPCSFQPTALWKAIKMTSGFEKEIKVNNSEVVNLIIENVDFKEMIFDIF